MGECLSTAWQGSLFWIESLLKLIFFKPKPSHLERQMGMMRMMRFQACFFVGYGSEFRSCFCERECGLVFDLEQEMQNLRTKLQRYQYCTITL